MKQFALFAAAALSLFGWEMRGVNTTMDIDIQEGIIWWYDRSGWHECCEESPYLGYTITGGSAYWSNAQILQNTATPHTSYQWQEGWNFVTPIFGAWELSTHFKANVPFAWRYADGRWYLFSQESVSEFPSFTTLQEGEGAWIYVPNIDIYFDNLPLFCENGECSPIINSGFSYKMSLKVPEDQTIKFAYDLYRYSNDTHYKLAVGPLTPNNLQTLISICVTKADTSSCKKFDNAQEQALAYRNGYLTIDAQKIAQLFDKSIPDVQERFFMEIYVEGITPEGFIPKTFGTIGIEGFGTWVTLDNSVAAGFEMESR